MSTSSSVVQLDAVSSMSGPHSILEIGEKNEKKQRSAVENVGVKGNQQANTSENNHLQVSNSSSLSTQPHSAQPHANLADDGESSVTLDPLTANKRPPPLEVCISLC